MSRHASRYDISAVLSGSSSAADEGSSTAGAGTRSSSSSAAATTTNAGAGGGVLSLAKNPYLPSSLQSLGTSLTSAGTLPKPVPRPSSSSAAAAPSSSSASSAAAAATTATRRSLAPPLVFSDDLSTPRGRAPPRSALEPYVTQVRAHWDKWQAERTAAAAASTSAHANNASDKMERAGESKQLPSLARVPDVFFDPKFNLSNPRTFDLVTERVRLVDNTGGDVRPATPPPPSRADERATSLERNTFASELMYTAGKGPLTLADLATDSSLQDKLSDHTATVEAHLASEIARRSDAFFAALNNLQDLHRQGDETLGKIAQLRAAIAGTTTTGSTSTEATTTQPPQSGPAATAYRGLETLRLQARRRALERIASATAQVAQLAQGLDAVSQLADSGDFLAALDVADGVRDALVPANNSNNKNEGGQVAPTDKQTSSTLRLNRVKALQHVPARLDALRAQIARALESELVALLAGELEATLEEHERRRRRQSQSSTDPPAAAVTDLTVPLAMDEDEDSNKTARLGNQLRPLVQALVRANGLESAVAAWRDSTLRDVRALVRQHLPASALPSTNDADDDSSRASSPTPLRGKASSSRHSKKPSLARSLSSSIDEVIAGAGGAAVSDKSAALARALRALSHDQFLRLAGDTYANLLRCLEAIDGHAKVLAALIGESSRAAQRANGAKAPRRAEVARTPKRSNSLAVPGSALDQFTHATIEESPVEEEEEEEEEEEDETTSAIMTDVNTIVQSAAELATMRFSKVIGVRAEQHAALALDDFLDIFDLSQQFVAQSEKLCKRMLVGLRGVMLSHAKALLQATHQRRLTESARLVENEQWSPVEADKDVQQAVAFIVASAVSDPAALLTAKRRAGRAADVPGDLAPTKQLDIEGHQYFGVSAGYASVALITDYLRVLVNLPLLVTDVMSKLIEYMKSFNSRTCQVVLGAGAMRSAGLKNITAKHLALASQALAIMISLIPYLREAIRRHMSPKQAVLLTEFDKLRRDYQEHQSEIHSKLVSIMSDRLAVHAKALEGIDWEAPARTPNSYVEALVKEHTTLFKVLNRFLHASTVDAIMSQVFKALDARLRQELGRVTLRSEPAKDRMLADARYLREKLKELKGLEHETPGQELERLVLEKPLPASARPSTSSRPSMSADERRPHTPAKSPPPLPPSPSLVSSSDEPRPSISRERSNQDLPQLPNMVLSQESLALPGSSSAPGTPAPPSASAMAPAPSDEGVSPKVEQLVAPAPPPQIETRIIAPTPPAPPSEVTSPTSTPTSPTENGARPPRRSMAERLAEIARRGSRPQSRSEQVATPSIESLSAPPIAAPASAPLLAETPPLPPMEPVDVETATKPADEVAPPTSEENAQPPTGPVLPDSTGDSAQPATEPDLPNSTDYIAEPATKPVDETAAPETATDSAIEELAGDAIADQQLDNAALAEAESALAGAAPDVVVDAEAVTNAAEASLPAQEGELLSADAPVMSIPTSASTEELALAAAALEGDVLASEQLENVAAGDDTALEADKVLELEGAAREGVSAEFTDEDEHVEAAVVLPPADEEERPQEKEDGAE